MFREPTDRRIVGCMIGVQQCDQHIDIQQCAHLLRSADLEPHPLLDGCPALCLPRTFDTGIRAGYSWARKAPPRALALTKVSDAIASKVQRSSAPPPLCAAGAAAAAAAV